jgi:hypothetical protein
LTRAEVSKHNLLLFAWEKFTACHTNLKLLDLPKGGRSDALLGLNFRFCFTSLWPAEGSMRPNRAVVTPIGQQNPPVQLKLLVLYGKHAKKTPIFILPQKPVISVYVLLPGKTEIIGVCNHSHKALV